MTAALTSVNDSSSQAPSLRQLLAAEARAALARRKISNRRFAAMLGAKPAWVDRRLNGTTAMDADDIDTFAGALGLTAEELTAGAFQEARRIAGASRSTAPTEVSTHWYDSASSSLPPVLTLVSDTTGTNRGVGVEYGSSAPPSGYNGSRSVTRSAEMVNDADAA